MKHDPLIRLREANPVPGVPAVDGADLFERIVALAQESRPARRPRPVRRGVAVALVFVVAAIVASTAYAISNWVGSGPVKPRVTHHEYRLAQHQLTLPPGYSWPSLHIDPNSVTGAGAGGGHAVLAAQNAWECYWVDAIRTGDTVAQHRARSELTALLDHNVLVAPAGAPENWTPPNPPKTPYAVLAGDGGYQWVPETYALAAAGHPQRLIDRCQANKAG
jgi:hypothetical protein